MCSQSCKHSQCIGAGMESIGIPLAPSSRPTSRPSRALLKLDSQYSTPSQFQKFMPSGSLSPLGRFKKNLGEGHPGAAWKDKQTCTSTRASSGGQTQVQGLPPQVSVTVRVPLNSILGYRQRQGTWSPQGEITTNYTSKSWKKSFELSPSVFKFQFFHHFLLGNFRPVTHCWKSLLPLLLRGDNTSLRGG